MENFEFVSPTRFVFGRDVEAQVGERLKAEAPCARSSTSAADRRWQAG